MMTENEIEEYLRTPSPRRDREPFIRDQIAKARAVIERIQAESIDISEPERQTA